MQTPKSNTSRISNANSKRTRPEFLIFFLEVLRWNSKHQLKKLYCRSVQMRCYKYLPHSGASQAAAAPLTLLPVPLPTGGCASAACLMVHTMSSISALSWRSDIAAGRTGHHQGTPRGHTATGDTQPQGDTQQHTTPHTRYFGTFIEAFLPPLFDMPFASSQNGHGRNERSPQKCRLEKRINGGEHKEDLQN